MAAEAEMKPRRAGAWLPVILTSILSRRWALRVDARCAA